MSGFATLTFTFMSSWSQTSENYPTLHLLFSSQYRNLSNIAKIFQLKKCSRFCSYVKQHWSSWYYCTIFFDQSFFLFWRRDKHFISLFLLFDLNMSQPLEHCKNFPEKYFFWFCSYVKQHAFGIVWSSLISDFFYFDEENTILLFSLSLFLT
jgi:hypothetical protein